MSEPTDRAPARILSADAALRQRLRGLFRIPFPSDERLLLLAACDPSGARIQGYAALYAHRGDAGGRGFLLAWELVPGQREALLAPLLGLAIARARAAGAGFVDAYALLADDSDAARCLVGLGFEVGERLETYEVPYQNVLARAGRICRAAERRGLRPPGALLDHLRPEHGPAVRALFHRERILTGTELDLRLAPGHPEPIDRAGSTLILLDGDLLGVMLIAPLTDPKGYSVPARWVRPDLRRGWVNAALLATSCERVRPLGLEYVHFTGNTARHDETRRLGERLGGRVLPRGGRYTLTLGSRP